MLSYILRRIVATLPVMAIVALFVFSLLYIAQYLAYIHNQLLHPVQAVHITGCVQELLHG